MSKLLISITREIKSHKLVYITLAILLGLAFFVRTYRTDDLLRFYYDQGRDALVIRDMIHIPKPVLIGPTTGLAGILRGPAFYYLIFPAYLVSHGSPVATAIWLQIVNIIGLIFVYLVSKEIFGRFAGLLAVTLMGLNNHMVSLSRWLSNPSPILTSVPIMLYGLIQIDKKNRPQLWWPIVALMVGLNLQFEMASEMWFIPAILLLIILRKQMRPNLKTLIISAGIFVGTLLPQLFFDMRHGHLMLKAITQHFASSTQPAFAFSLKLIENRWNMYLDSFALTIAERSYWIAILLTTIALLLLLARKFKDRIWVLVTPIAVPLFILTFYQGNEGNFYSYYLIGLFPIFLILMGGTLAWCFSKRIIGLVALIIIVVFANINITLLRGFLSAGLDGSENIVLGNQLAAINWIYQKNHNQPFNVDVYVPPVIPYSYDYLIWWQADTTYHQQPATDLQPMLFTIWEVDTESPARAQAWLDRQSHIGEVKEVATFGGVHVERRVRKF